MAGEFKFPDTLQFDGISWRLLYAPYDPKTVPPNLSEAQIPSFTCNPVAVSGRDTPLYIAIADVIFPAQRDSTGRIVGERRLKGFRIFSQRPYSPNDVKINDCVFYIAETSGVGGSVAQRFFDALIGHAPTDSAGQSSDASWCKELAVAVQEPVNESEIALKDAAQCAVSD